jgi:hypothetical protein
VTELPEFSCRATARHGMAWAFEQAMGLVWYYEVSNSLVSLWGRRTHAGSPTS